MSRTTGEWTATDRFRAQGYPFTIEADGRTIATVAPGGTANTADDPDSNAEFIVRACNVHDEIVEALREVRRHVSEEPMSEGYVMEITGPALKHALGILDGRIDEQGAV